MSYLARCLVLFVVVAPVAAGTDYEGPMRFSIFEPCRGSASICGATILAQGSLERNSSQKFAAFVAERRAELPPTPTVVFDSHGGSLNGAMALGRVIRRNRFNTRLESSYSYENSVDVVKFIGNAKCASACAFAFVGGLRREISDDARFGIHQFSGASGDIGEGVTQKAVVALAAYLAEMGVSRRLLDAASLVPPTTIYWLAPKDAQRLRVDNSRPILIPWTVKASPSGKALLYTAAEISQGRRVSLIITTKGNNAVVHAVTQLQRKTYSADRIKQFPLDMLPALTFSVDGESIETQPLTPWSQLDQPGAVVFRTSVAISLAALQTLARAQKLSVSDNFGTATSDVSLSTALSIDGLQSGIALLLRAH